MDHRISKDMISSGMIPSGEKKQEDLSRTQYGTAPSPNALSDVYKKMYETKEEVINEMKMGDVSGSADFASRNIKGAKGASTPKPGGITPYKDPKKAGGITPYKDPKKAGGITPYKKPETTAADRPKPETKSMVDTVRDRRKEVVSARREKVQGIMNKYGESVDLLAAYRAVYEHHKKDADGNTIPHEGEEIKEEPITLAALAAGAGKLLAGAGAKAAAAGATKAAAAGATKAAAAGAGKAAAASAGKAAGSTIAKGGIQKTITRAGIKAGGKTGGRIAQSIAKDPMGALDKAADISYKTQMVGSMLPKPKPRTSGSGGGGVYGGMSQNVSAGADLFDIVKGQLLDEGLSEEEIKDIMLTLTPDEIMEELSDVVKRNDAINKANAMKAAQEKREKSTPPKEVTDAAKRQYKAGSPGAEPYTTADKKTIINYNKNK